MKLSARVYIQTALVLLLSSLALAQSNEAAGEWAWYGLTIPVTRYSPLKQINRRNVTRLRVAWTFHTGDVSDGSRGRGRSGFETTPIMVEDRLFLTTPFNRVIALNPGNPEHNFGL